MRKSIIGISLSLASAWAMAQVTLPYTFTPGTPAKAAEVNADFQALATAINKLSARVEKLEGTIAPADLVGTYALNQFQTELGGNGMGEGLTKVYTGKSTLILSPGGKGVLKNHRVAGSQLNWPSATRSVIDKAEPQLEFRWSYANGALTILDMPFNVVAGGRLLVGASAGTDDGTNVLLLLTRVK